MINYPITYLSAASLLAGAAGLIPLFFRKHLPSFLKDYWMLLTLFLVISILRGISNVLEWSTITLSMDWFEDFIEIFQAFLLGILLYSIFQHRMLETVQESETKSRKLVDQMTESQAEREELLQKLEFKNRELQSIVYIASHDLKSPLVNIIGFNGELRLACRKLAEILEPFPNPELQRQVQPIIRDIQESQMFIESGGQKMQVLIDGLLTVSRIGTQPIHIEPVDMNALIEGILRSMKYQIQKSGASIHVETLPPCMGDPGQVNQVFSNLIDNAIKYLDPNRPGTITISGEASNKLNLYHVSDNGIGIRPEYFDKIFEIYHRLNPGDKNKGQGLGLTIILRIMERLGGQVSVRFSLPCSMRVIDFLPQLSGVYSLHPAETDASGVFGGG
jgi:signal transduction histidine kinase